MFIETLGHELKQTCMLCRFGVDVVTRYISLGDLLVLSRGNHGAVVVLKAFFDESGHSGDSAFVCLGGCIASLEAWTEFEIKWEQKLHQYGIACFHMTDFESNWGEFENWKED